MTEQETQEELLTRFELVEMMVKEGRRSTEYWGWTFVLWGTAYLIAIGWTYWSHRPDIAWPVTMIAARVLTIVVATRKKRARPRTPVSRAISGIWTGRRHSHLYFLFCSRSERTCRNTHLHGHSGDPAGGCQLRHQHGASLARPILDCASLVGISAVATCFVAMRLVMPILVFDTLVGFLGFGLYLMYRERRDRRLRVQHA